MDGSISGCLKDAVTDETLLSPRLSLTRHGVLGESFAQVDERGQFIFRALPAGSYCMGAHDNHYAPLYHRLTLEQDQSVENLEISLTPGAFLKGRILDEDGYPPHRCHFTLIRAGNRGERLGYISDSGDHEIAQDGLFASPPLHPGRYFLRFAGILRKPSESDPSQPVHGVMQERIFDFLCPNALEIEEAHPFDLQTGQTMTGLEIRIPRPIWRTVRGKVTGALPEGLANVYVHFVRDVGMLDDFGGGGPPVKADGTFEGQAQPGRYRLSVWEMAPPQPNGHTRGTQQFESVEVTVGDRNLDGLEIHVSPLAASQERQPLSSLPG
jgi:hypothetical protein